MLHTFQASKWDENFSTETQQEAITNLEAGQVLFFPKLAFELTPEETFFLSPEHADPHSKNISYSAKTNQLWGVQRLTDKQRTQLKLMLDRFSRYTFHLMQRLLPHYHPHLIVERTSFRPVEISDRKTSYRKDDKRLHVDAFPSAPNQGKRIIRVFTNINPKEERIWRLGEPFSNVAKRFLPEIKKPLPGSGAALRLLRVTKSMRTHYDHYMLNLHDLMKGDEQYQAQAQQEKTAFPPQSTWIVQTDQVSHAAMAGQYCLEQTYYLPVHAMQDESQSPLRVLEKMVGARLV